MTEMTFTDSKPKELLKLALTEVLQEQRELFAEVVLEMLEDVALVTLIKEGEETERVSREAIDEIFQARQPQNKS